MSFTRCGSFIFSGGIPHRRRAFMAWKPRVLLSLCLLLRPTWFNVIIKNVIWLWWLLNFKTGTIKHNKANGNSANYCLICCPIAVTRCVCCCFNKATLFIVQGTDTCTHTQCNYLHRSTFSVSIRPRWYKFQLSCHNHQSAHVSLNLAIKFYTTTMTTIAWLDGWKQQRTVRWRDATTRQRWDDDDNNNNNNNGTGVGDHDEMVIIVARRMNWKLV